MNKVSLNGNLGKDPQVRTLKSGSEYAYFSLATNDYYKNKEGEWVRNTDWHNVVVWNWKEKTARFEVKRGNRIELLGRLRTRQYIDKDGRRRYLSEIIALEIKPAEAEEEPDFRPAA